MTAASQFKDALKTVGLPPGTLVHVGERKVDHTIISIFDYNEEGYVEKCAKSVEESFKFKDTPTVTWINVDGIQDVEIIKKVQTHFDVHPLVLEDILNTSQRPKMEDYGEYIYMVLKMLYVDTEKNTIESEQISLILRENCVISFQETEGDIFDNIRDRIRNFKGRVRKMGADYLAYALIDSIVDNYFVLLEYLDEKIEKLEDELLEKSNPDLSHEIHQLRRDLISLRKQVWPIRELINGLQRVESKLIGKDTNLYLRDVYDHSVQVIDAIESFRDILGGLHDIHLSSISNRMNEVIKVLTVISTIFIPLTFIVGIYGMNFEHMPELNWWWSYPALWIVMLTIGIGMFIFFKKKNWI